MLGNKNIFLSFTVAEQTFVQVLVCLYFTFLILMLLFSKSFLIVKTVHTFNNLYIDLMQDNVELSEESFHCLPIILPRNDFGILYMDNF